MCAVMRDFPKYYKEITCIETEKIVSVPAFEKSSFSVVFDFDGQLGCYSAAIEGLDILAYGDTYQTAVHFALQQRKYLMAINRLKELPPLTNTGGQDAPW